MSYAELLRSQSKKVGIWGLGTIGYSSLVYFGLEGVQSVGYDIDDLRVQEVNESRVNIAGMDNWLNVDTTDLVKNKMISATNNDEELLREDILVHLIGVPTEVNGEPHSTIVEDVVLTIGNSAKRNNHQPLIIIESTLTPGTILQQIVPLLEKHDIECGKDIFLNISPRRDWFNDGGYALKGLDRVFGGVTTDCADRCGEVLAIVCDKLHRASEVTVAEFTKVVENAYRFLNIMFANQLSEAFPGINIIEVLKLAGTKWNIETFTPSFGPGGHCIPVAGRHLIKCSEESQLDFMRTAVQDNFQYVDHVIDRIKATGCKQVLVLGVSYRADTKMPTLSAPVSLIHKLKKEGITFKVCDPYYADMELEELLNVTPHSLNEELEGYDAIILGTNHKVFCKDAYINKVREIESLSLVIDNYGGWADVNWKEDISYCRPGDGSWKWQLPHLAVEAEPKLFTSSLVGESL